MSLPSFLDVDWPTARRCLDLPGLSDADEQQEDDLAAELDADEALPSTIAGLFLAFIVLFVMFVSFQLFLLCR